MSTDKPTRIILRSDTIDKWLSAESTNLLYGEIGIGYDSNGKSIIAKIGSKKEGEKWSDAPQISATADSLGLDIENVGRVYSSVVVDSENKPIIDILDRELFYDVCSSTTIEYLYGSLEKLPHSLKTGTDNLPPNTDVLNYGASADRKSFIRPQHLSGWNEEHSFSPIFKELPFILDAPVGFVHPEFGNVIPYAEAYDSSTDGTFSVHLSKLPIQPIQAPLSVLAWLEDVEMWSLPVSGVSQTSESSSTPAMRFIGTVSGWFPFPYRQFVCSGTKTERDTDRDIIQPQLSCMVEAPIYSTAFTGSGSSFGRIDGITIQDPNYNCNTIPDYCDFKGICTTCGDNIVSIEQGEDWITSAFLTFDEENEELNTQGYCEPRTYSLFFTFEGNDTIYDRVGKIRVYNRFSKDPLSSDSKVFTLNHLGQDCKITNLYPNALNLSASASVNTVLVRTNAIAGECDFSVSTEENWITISESTTDSSFTVSVPIHNTGSVHRSGEVVVTITETGETQTLFVKQEVDTSICIPSGLNTRINVAQEGSTENITFTVGDQSCEWVASVEYLESSSTIDWVTVNQTTGTGDANITATVSANPEITSRSAIIKINGEEIQLEQAAKICDQTQPAELYFAPNATPILWAYPSFCSAVFPDAYAWGIKVYGYECNECDVQDDSETCRIFVNVDDIYFDSDTNDNNKDDTRVAVVGAANNAQEAVADGGNGQGWVYGVGYIAFTYTKCFCHSTVHIPYTVQKGPEDPGITYEIVLEGDISHCGSLPTDDTCQCCEIASNNENCDIEKPEPKCEDGCTEEETGEECNFCFQDPNTGNCFCACDDQGTLPKEINGEPKCFCTTGGGGGDGPGGGESESGYFCDVPTTGNPQSLETVFTPQLNISGETINLGIWEIDTVKVANSFVKIKGYLNPGVSPIWDNVNKTWVPKQVPNFYSDELLGEEGEGGYVYYDMLEGKWKITNTIDGGGAF